MSSGARSVILVADMDYEFEDEPLEGRILWGRIGVYGAAFVLVFLLGSCFGSRSAPSDDELEQLSEQVQSLASENAVLEEQLAAATAGRQDEAAPTTGDGTQDEDTDGAGQDDPEPTGDGESPPDGGEETPEAQVYTVESGDSLYRIANEFYGDGTKWRLIAEENGLDDDNPLTVGQELRIPPAD